VVRDTDLKMEDDEVSVDTLWNVQGLQYLLFIMKRQNNLTLSHVFLLPIQKISEQPCSNGEPVRHTVMWEGIRTTHKPSESPMGHVPMGTTKP